MRIPLLLLVCSLTPAYATVRPNDCDPHRYRHFVEIHPADFSKAYAELEKEMENPKQTLKTIEKDSGYIEEVLEELDHQPGGTAAVYRVRTKDGVKVIKFYRAQMPLEHFGHSLVLHKKFGELGLAPALRGLLAPDEVEKLAAGSSKLRNNNRIDRYPNAGFAVVMDEVPGAWLLKDVNAKLPKASETWDEKDLKAQARGMVAAFNGLRCIPADPQFLISETGRLYVFDMDAYYWVNRQNQLLGSGANHMQDVYDGHPMSSPGGQPLNQPSYGFESLIDRFFRRAEAAKKP